MNSVYILIIDDDRGDRMLIKRLLKSSSLPFKFIEAETVEEAISQAEKRKFDCIIIDYLMPGMNGLDGTKKFKNIYPFIPVIMATGQADAQIAVEVMKSGADDYLSKEDMTSEALERLILSSIEKSILQTKLHSQQESLQNFSKILSHDLKSPIQNIIGFGDMVKETIQKYQNPELNQMLDFVTSSAKRMSKLIDAVNEYMVLGQETPLSITRLSHVIDGAISDLSHIIFESKAKIVQENTEQDILLNKVMMRQVIQNLISNSIKYCQEDPLITISYKEDKEQAIISISDNGIGIEEKYAKRVFEPFVRLHGNDTYQGTGLGLATCHKIVQMHNGHIECLQNAGTGVTMRITLPTKNAVTPILQRIGQLRNL